MIALGQAWRHRALILAFAVAALLAITKRQQEKIGGLEQLLAAKPRVEERIHTKVVQGPVRVVEKIREIPGGERIIERETVREVRVTEADTQHTETPICPAPARAPRWVFAGQAEIPNPRAGQLLRAGVTLGGRVDLTVGHSLPGSPQRRVVDIAWRF